MKLLHVTATMDPAAGGVCQAIRLLVPELEDLGAFSEVACMDKPIPATQLDEGATVHRLGPGKFGWAYSSAAVPWLVKNMPRFDAVIVHGLWLYPSVAVWRACKILQKKIRNRREVPFYIYPHGMLDPYFQIAPERRLKAVRNFFYWKLLEHRVVRDAQGLLFTCEEERLLARQPFCPYNPKNERVTGLGVESPPSFTLAMKAAFDNALPGLGNQPYFLFLSRIHPKKGVDLIIKAYAETQRVSDKVSSPRPALVIAGPGRETFYGRKMQMLAAQCCPDAAVFWPGMLGGDAKWGALHGCEAFVLPSHQENFGIAVVEALACGRPVLISNKVNIWREIESSGAGLVAENTDAGVRALLQRWSEVTPEKYRTISEAARRCFNASFSIKKAALSLMDVLKQ